MRFPSAMRRSPAVEAWFVADALRAMVQPWFATMRDCGDDVRELLHDGCPTACVEDAAFAYVNAFAAHANVGFFQGASLEDPCRLLQGNGKRMRHVKLRWGEGVEAEALKALISAAYEDIRDRLSAEGD
ncbi:MAG TPA: DUF1801 domain-containing protein [Caulobacteraceae bacterium]